MHAWTYTAGVALFLGAWAGLFALVPASRSVALGSALAWGHAGPISELWHRADYWRPEYLLSIELDGWVFGAEDYLFAFAFAGLCAGGFDALIRRRGAGAVRGLAWGGFARLVAVGLVCLALMGGLARGLGVNSVYAIGLVFTVGGAALIAVRPRWLVPALQVAALAGLFMWLAYWGYWLRLFPEAIERWWLLDNLSGTTLGGVPVEEPAWAALTALFVGPVSRLCLERGQRRGVASGAPWPRA